MPAILIIDDHLLVRQGLKQMLSLEYRDLIFGDARSSDEALALMPKRPWDLVILDVSIPGVDGFHVLREIRQHYPATRVLMLTMHANSGNPERAYEMGAYGYVCKSSGRNDLLRAIAAALGGKKSFGELVLPENGEKLQPKHVGLSAREYRVMLACASGKRTKDIAGELKVSIKTISTYKRRLLDKLNLESTADVVRYVLDNHLADGVVEQHH
jgi:two-component system, NarL family, invasion response regulator UvrY